MESSFLRRCLALLVLRAFFAWEFVCAIDFVRSRSWMVGLAWCVVVIDGGR